MDTCVKLHGKLAKHRCWSLSVQQQRVLFQWKQEFTLHAIRRLWYENDGRQSQQGKQSNIYREGTSKVGLLASTTQPPSLSLSLPAYPRPLSLPSSLIPHNSTHICFIASSIFRMAAFRTGDALRTNERLGQHCLKNGYSLYNLRSFPTSSWYMSSLLSQLRYVLWWTI